MDKIAGMILSKFSSVFLRADRRLLVTFACCLVLVPCIDNCRPSHGQEIRFGREVRPILAKHCLTCHGPDSNAREADLRLDTQQGAYADLGGYQAIKPHDIAASALITRIVSDDPDLRMPPADSHPPLSAREIEVLSAWIQSGATYQTHWSFVPPESVAVPDVVDASWCRNGIDRFTLNRMEQRGLTPSQPATKAKLIRRLYLDLTGVTPPPDEVDRFVEDDDPKAYRKLVDRLLASPDYGERFARPWLDLARYSDTNGYEKDRPRTIWPFRDWVIGAIGDDMPFDQFSIEQLAGDMLPDATLSQRIATGFHRNTMLNEEGGIDPLEYRFYAMVDRVATTGTVWMGLTTGCAQCHTHKYDPITHTDYYSFLALMNNADEPEVTADPAEVREHCREIEQQIRRRENELAREVLDSSDPQHEAIRADYEQWRQQQIDTASDWTVLRPTSLTTTMPRLSLTLSGSILASGDVTKRDVYTLEMPPVEQGITAIRLEVLPHASLPANGPGMAFYEGRRGDFFLSEFKVRVADTPIRLERPSASYGKISVGSGGADASNVLDGNGSTGWSTSDQQGTANRLVVNFAEPFSSTVPWTIELLFERHFAAALGHFRLAVTTRTGGANASAQNADLESQLNDVRVKKNQLGRTAEKQLSRQYIQTNERLKEHRKPIDVLRRAIQDPVRTLVLRERSQDDQRTTHRHHRGEYLQPKEAVQPAGLSAFQPLDDAHPKDRLALARWLVSDKNPLVGRVTVNRAWRQFFGTGIVRTAGDFGTQSELPSHPQLIDYLAGELTSGDWSMKRLHRNLVLSATYAQAVGGAPVKDPDNRLLSRFPHRRLDAERIRDAMLSAAGLMTRQIGGPSVYPPQPATVSQMAYGSPNWRTSSGADRYRKSLYTFSQRTAPFAASISFDGPTGELCLARRERSTTPLQALTLLNDKMYLEIAAALAESAIRDVGDAATAEQIATRIFRRLLVREPEPDELQAIVAFYHRQAKGDKPWLLVARALMNTDEAITTP